MIFNMDHSQLSRKKKTSETKVVSTGHLQIIYRSFTDHLHIIYRSSTDNLQVIYISLHIIYRSFTDHLQLIDYLDLSGQVDHLFLVCRI